MAYRHEKRDTAALGYVLGAIVLSALPQCRLEAQARSTGEAAATSNVITLNPSTTVRGSSFDVTVTNAPPGASKVEVELDGRRLPSPLFDPKFPGILHASVPDSTDPHSPDYVPLGTHRVSVRYDGHWYTAGTTLTVIRPEQTTPVLREAAPLEIGREQADRKVVLTGANFLTDPPEDNQVLLGGLPLPVVWDGCENPTKWAKGEAHVTHGSVEPTGASITLCNFPTVGGTAPEIAIRQGDKQSTFLTLHAPPLSKARIVASSVAVNLTAVALVVFLAHFVRKYRVGNTKYGMFRILFLDPETNTYSLSKYQFYMWTGAALFAYAYFALSRVFVQEQLLPDVPSSLPAIIGIGAGTAIGSQLVTSIRGPKGGGSEMPSLGDFVTTGGVAAADRVQMFVWTTFGVFAFCLATLRAAPWEITGLPQVGTGLMYLMGLSSVGYLGGKLARKPGPVLSEISISPGRLDDGAEPNPIRANFAQPIGAAQQVAQQGQITLQGITKADSPAAYPAAQDALQMLQASIAAASAGSKDMLDTMGRNAVVADADARTAAAEFERNPSDENRTLAEIAQECAAAVQGLATGSAQAVGVAQAASASPAAATPSLRVIDLRGRNLSIDGTFEINDIELPFRMLAPVNGARAPRLVAAEEDNGTPNMGRELQLVLAPDALGKADRESYDAWFAKPAPKLKLSIINPDGQRSEISFSVPPAASQANG